MFQCPDASVFQTLAQLLTGAQSDPAVLWHALELICQQAGMEHALVYMVDFSNRLCPSADYSASALPFDPAQQAEKLAPQEQRELAGHSSLFLAPNPALTPLEARLLALHRAKALILLPVAEGEGHICGMVALFNTTGVLPADPEGRAALAPLLAMLTYYAGAGMYRARIVQSRLIWENILDNTGIDIYVNDYDNHDILYINQSMAAPYGGCAEFEGRKCWQVLFPEQSGPCPFCPRDKLLDADGSPKEVYSWDYQRAMDGAWFRVFSSAFYWADGRLAHVVSSANITDNKRNEAMIETLANYDQLTKLPNRRMLVKECERRIDKATETEAGYVLFFDIDGFKAINDNYGHDAGDEFLIALGAFFSGIPLLQDAIYRNGGDEFVAIVGGEGVTKDHIRDLAHQIHSRFQLPWVLKKGEIFCNTSIGVACFPEDGRTAEVLLQKADMAMYQVKKSGGGGLCFGYQLL